MADNNFDILIRILTQQVGSEKATDILKKVREETTATGKEAVKQEEAVEAATKKTFASKHQLKDMVKQLGHEFPILGQVGRLALNPIAFTTAAITGAFFTWNQRVRDLSISLGGIEMPGVNQTDSERLKSYADAMKQVASATNAAADAETRFEANVKARLATLKANEELFAAWGMGGSGGDEQRARIIGSAAAEQAAAARSRIAAAGTPGSVDKENNLGSKYAVQAAAAEAAKADAQNRLMELADVGGGSVFNPMRHVRNFQYLRRYGGMNVEDAKAEERSVIASQQGIIDSAARFQFGSVGRAGRRADIADGEKSLKAVGSKDDEVVMLLRQIASATAGRAPFPGSRGGENGPAQFAQEFAAFLANFPEVVKAVERANTAVKNLSQRP